METYVVVIIAFMVIFACQVAAGLPKGINISALVNFTRQVLLAYDYDYVIRPDQLHQFSAFAPWFCRLLLAAPTLLYQH